MPLCQISSDITLIFLPTKKTAQKLLLPRFLAPDFRFFLTRINFLSEEFCFYKLMCYSHYTLKKMEFVFEWSAACIALFKFILDFYRCHALINQRFENIDKEIQNG